MSDTPETDAALYPMNGVDIVWPDFARKLERERDEAIRQRNETNESSVFSCNFYYEEKLKAERERDEAREKAERYRLEANSLMLQRDEARESLKHIGEYGTEEINAAVDLRQKLAFALVKYDNLATEHMLVVNKLCKERDDARDALSRIDEIFCDGEDTHDDWMKMGNIAKDYFKGLE